MQRPQSWPGWARLYVRIFRIVVPTSFLVAAAVGWVSHTPWLLAAGLTIAVGELLECTYYLVVLDWAERTNRLRRP